MISLSPLTNFASEQQRTRDKFPPLVRDHPTHHRSGLVLVVGGMAMQEAPNKTPCKTWRTTAVMVVMVIMLKCLNHLLNAAELSVGMGDSDDASYHWNILEPS